MPSEELLLQLLRRHRTDPDEAAARLRAWVEKNHPPFDPVGGLRQLLYPPQPTLPDGLPPFTYYFVPGSGQGSDRMLPSEPTNLNFLKDADGIGLNLGWHDGATAGSCAFIAFSRKTGSGVVILTNTEKAPGSLAFGLLGTKFRKPKVEVLKNAADYVGRYPLNPAFTIDVTESNGTLRLQATGQSRLRMREITPDRFTVNGVVRAHTLGTLNSSSSLWLNLLKLVFPSTKH